MNCKFELTFFLEDTESIYIVVLQAVLVVDIVYVYVAAMRDVNLIVIPKNVNESNWVSSVLNILSEKPLKSVLFWWVLDTI